MKTKSSLFFLVLFLVLLSACKNPVHHGKYIVRAKGTPLTDILEEYNLNTDGTAEWLVVDKNGKVLASRSGTWSSLEGAINITTKDSKTEYQDDFKVENGHFTNITIADRYMEPLK